MNTLRQSIIAEIDKERDRQDKLHPNQNNLTPSEWHVILTEEVGEVAKEICDNGFKNIPLGNYRKELIEVAATALRIIETYDKTRELKMEIDLTKNQIFEEPVECWVNSNDKWIERWLKAIVDGVFVCYINLEHNIKPKQKIDPVGMWSKCSLTNPNAPKVKKWETIYDVPPELWGRALVKGESEDIQKATILIPQTACFTNTTELYKDICYLPLCQPLNGKWLPFESEVKE